MTLADRVARAADQLVRAGVDPREAVADAELLARHVLGWDRATYLVRFRDPMPTGFDLAYQPVIRRRVDREPVSLITERGEFWGLELAIAPGVLTPRPETELIVEAAIAWGAARRDDPVAIADVGTGSGCLAIALGIEFPHARITAIDSAAAAVSLTRRNIETHALDDRITVVEQPFAGWLRDRADADPEAWFDLIVANLPYIPSTETAALPPEVRRYEPAAALDGGSDGLEVIRELLGIAPAALRPDGRLIIEIGVDQHDAISSAVASIPGLTLLEFKQDLQGIDRTVVIAV